MDVISIALLISVLCNTVQIVFYLCRLYGDCRQIRQEVELKQQRKSYHDLQENDGAIFF